MPALPRLLYLLLPAATLTLLSGCTQLDLKKPLSWPFASEDKPKVPNRVVAVWSDSVLYKADRPPERGFGGRLMFYGREGDEPIKVDGSLVVYAFDEAGRDPSNARPDQKYVFPREHFDTHYSKSELGHSYSVWIPWDEVGGEQKEISLIARFLPANGAPLVGEQAKHLLPGTPPEPARRELAQQVRPIPAGEREVRPVSYEAPIGGGEFQGPADGAPPQRMSSTTISVPPRFGRQRPVATIGPRAAKQPMILRPGSANPAPTGQPAEAQAVPQQQRPAQAVPAQQGQLPPRARFSPARSRPPAAPIAQPRRDHTAWPLRPATSPSAPGSQLPRARPLGPVGNSTAAGPAPY